MFYSSGLKEESGIAGEATAGIFCQTSLFWLHFQSLYEYMQKQTA